MTKPPHITVTMLGTTKCGKTTYLLGMYAALSAGLGGYFLHADHPDIDLELSENWDALVDDGQLPPPTPNQPKTYPFAFRSGFTRLVTIDWLDYRGGAMTDRSDAEDAKWLVDRLAKSDSIYLTLDGAVLQDGVNDRNYTDIQRRTKSRRMTGFVQDAQERLGRVPSLVVLITKFDLIARRASSGADAVEQAIEAAKLILPIAFEPGVTALVCPVSLGDLGDAEDGQIDASRVAPRWVHKPMLFSMQRGQVYESNMRAATAEAEQAKYEAATYQAEALQRGFLSIFRGGRIDEALNRTRTEAQRVEETRRLEEQADRQAKKLAEEFAELPIFVDGKRVGNVYA